MTRRPRKPEEPPPASVAAWTEQLAAALVGTCMSIPEAAQQLGHPEWEEDFDPHYLDTMAFSCTRCDWWHGEDELEEDDAGQWICTECKAELGGSDG